MKLNPEKTYVGLDADDYGGMTPTGNIVRDARVFELIPEAETCAGWNVQRIQALYDQVYDAWEPYGHLVSNLPPELRERHGRIYEEAIRRAREQGWEPPMESPE